MGKMSVDEFFQKFFAYQWFQETYNMVILSRLYTKTPDLSNLINAFSINVWIFIFLSTICITVSTIFYRHIQGNPKISKFLMWVKITSILI